MPMKRRDFLNSSVVAGAAALMSPAVAKARRPSGPPAQLDVARPAGAVADVVARRSFSRAWFEKNLRTRFQIETEHGRAVEAELVELKDDCSRARLEQFSAVFRVPGGADVGGLRFVKHAEGRFQLLLGRPHDIGEARLCQAHFSLLV